MLTRFFTVHGKLSRPVCGFAIAAAALIMTGVDAAAEVSCFQVRGHYDEHIETTDCNSPVGFCIAGEYRGVIKGGFFGAATSFIPTADTPATTVVLFTSDSVIHAEVHDLRGDLIIKNAGAFQSAGEGNIVDLQIITGGTEELAGASGAIRASGLFDPIAGTGTSEYEGMICLP
jgi:hypothetical protein